MSAKLVRFGIIGLGLMGKEFASSVARWCNLLDENLPRPVITGVCDNSNETARAWFVKNFDSIKVSCTDYHELLASDEIDAIYCAVPHHLHQQIYTDIIRAGKHLLGEKPFGIDLEANSNIMNEINKPVSYTHLRAHETDSYLVCR